MSINQMTDPLQGYDIRVSVTPVPGGQANAAALSGTGAGTTNPTQLVGGFNSFMWRVVNQTDAYITLNSRIPRMLDGEVIVVWSLDQGLVNLNVVANTFGAAFATALGNGRTAIIPRSQRFNLLAEAGKDTIAAGTDFGEGGFNTTGGGMPTMAINIGMARVDTLTFGVAPGKAPAANSWQGTGEAVDDGSASQSGPPAP